MPSVRELVGDEQYAKLPPHAKIEVFETYADGDDEFRALSVSAQEEVKGVLGITSQPAVVAPPPQASGSVSQRAAATLAKIRADREARSGLVPQFLDRTANRFNQSLELLKGTGSDIGQMDPRAAIGMTAMRPIGGIAGMFSSPFAGTAGAAAEAVGGEGPMTEIAEEIGDFVAPMPPVLKGFKALRGARRLPRLAAEEGEAIPRAMKAAVGAGDEFPLPPAAPRPALLPKGMPPTSTSLGPRPVRLESEAARKAFGESPQPSLGRGATPAGIGPEEFIEDTGPALPKYAGNVSLDRLATDRDVKLAILEQSRRVQLPARMTEDDLRAEVARMGWDVEDATKFENLRKGEVARQFFAVRDVNAALNERYVAARNAWSEAQSPESLQQLSIAQANKLRGFKAASNAASEAGMILRSFGFDASGKIGQARAQRAIDEMLLEVERRGKLTDEVTKRLAMVDLDDAEQVKLFLNHLSPKTASFLDKVYEASQAGILTGIGTHTVNTTGNLTLAFLEAVPMKLAASGVDAARSAVTGAPRAVFAKEAFADLAGMLSGMEEGFRSASKAWRTELSSNTAMLRDFRRKGPAIGGELGRFVRVPFRALQAMDEFATAVNKRAGLNSAAWRTALREGLSGEKAAQRVAELLQRPTDEMNAIAKKVSDYRVLKEEPDALTKKALAIREAIPGGRWLQRFVVTPMNLIVRKGVDYSPFGALRIKKAASAAENSEQAARAMIGTLAASATGIAYMKGNITGAGPNDPEQRERLVANGWRPYSFKVGSNYVPYGRWEPLATIVGATATFMENMDRMDDQSFDKAATGLVKSFGRMAMDKVTMSGLSSMFDAISDPDRYGERFLAGLARPLVPFSGLLGGMARGLDPNERRTDSIGAKLQSGIPILREQLPPKRDVRGKPVPAAGGEGVGGFIQRFALPFQVSPERGDLAEQLMVELGAEIPPLPRKLIVANRTIQLTPEEYDRYQVLAGEGVDRLLKSYEKGYPKMQRRSREAQQKLLKLAVSNGRKAATAKMKKELLRTARARFDPKEARRFPGARPVESKDAS